MFAFTSQFKGNDTSCFIYTYKDEVMAMNGYDILVKAMKNDPLLFVKEVKLGKCKENKVKDLGVIEPYWLMISFPKKELMAIDDWSCNIEIHPDDIYTGPGRYVEYNAYTETIEQTLYKDGKALPPKVKVNVEWVDD